MEGAAWQVRQLPVWALRGQMKLRATSKIAEEEKLPRRWTELILRLNDMEKPTSKTKRPKLAEPTGGQAQGLTNSCFAGALPWVMALTAAGGRRLDHRPA